MPGDFVRGAIEPNAFPPNPSRTLQMRLWRCGIASDGIGLFACSIHNRSNEKGHEMRSSTCRSAGLILVLSLAPLGGCSRAIKQVYYEFRGAKAKIHPVREADPSVFAPYKSISFSPATTQSGELICPPSLLSEFDRAASEVVAELATQFPGGEPTLRISTDILFCQRKGAFSVAEVLARIRMTGGDKTIFECLVKSESKALTQRGEDDLSRACAKALGDFLIEQKDDAARAVQR